MTRRFPTEAKFDYFRGRGTVTKLLLTIEEAERYSLVGCTCGHPRNNHFTHGTRPCAHCKCQAFTLKARAGKLVVL